MLTIIIVSLFMIATISLITSDNQGMCLVFYKHWIGSGAKREKAPKKTRARKSLSSVFCRAEGGVTKKTRERQS